MEVTMGCQNILQFLVFQNIQMHIATHTCTHTKLTFKNESFLLEVYFVFASYWFVSLPCSQTLVLILMHSFCDLGDCHSHLWAPCVLSEMCAESSGNVSRAFASLHVQELAAHWITRDSVILQFDITYKDDTIARVRPRVHLQATRTWSEPGIDGAPWEVLLSFRTCLSFFF